MISLIVIFANIVSATRLMCYRRRESRYRPVVSIFAYLLIVCTGGQAIDILVNHTPTSPWQAGISLVIAALVWRARGNVAVMTRLSL